MAAAVLDWLGSTIWSLATGDIKLNPSPKSKPKPPAHPNPYPHSPPPLTLNRVRSDIEAAIGSILIPELTALIAGYADGGMRLIAIGVASKNERFIRLTPQLNLISQHPQQLDTAAAANGSGGTAMLPVRLWPAIAGGSGMASEVLRASPDWAGSVDSAIPLSDGRLLVVHAAEHGASWITGGMRIVVYARSGAEANSPFLPGAERDLSQTGDDIKFANPTLSPAAVTAAAEYEYNVCVSSCQPYSDDFLLCRTQTVELCSHVTLRAPAATPKPVAHSHPFRLWSHACMLSASIVAVLWPAPKPEKGVNTIRCIELYRLPQFASLFAAPLRVPFGPFGIDARTDESAEGDSRDPPPKRFGEPLLDVEIAAAQNSCTCWESFLDQPIIDRNVSAPDNRTIHMKSWNPALATAAGTSGVSPELKSAHAKSTYLLVQPCAGCGIFLHSIVPSGRGVRSVLAGTFVNTFGDGNESFIVLPESGLLVCCGSSLARSSITPALVVYDLYTRKRIFRDSNVCQLAGNDHRLFAVDHSTVGIVTPLNGLEIWRIARPPAPTATATAGAASDSSTPFCYPIAHLDMIHSRARIICSVPDW